METTYEKNLHHNYMVIKEPEDGNTEHYCMKMLSFISLEGLLCVEKRTIDNQIFYYYDISSKQSMKSLPERTVWTFSRVKQLFERIILTIEKAYEYLLIEDDFILEPECIYLDMAASLPYLCYLAGYHRDIKEQMSSFIEYMMNKTDYNDKEAVLLIYSLYSTSREEGFTFDRLLNTLSLQSFPILNDKKAETFQHVAEGSQSANMKPGIDGNVLKESSILQRDRFPDEIKGDRKTVSDPVIPVMKEKITDEKEISCFPTKAYLYTLICILGSILLFLLAIRTRIIYNTYGNRINCLKLVILLLMMACVNAYLLKRIWAKKNLTTRIVTRKEYIDPTRNHSGSFIQPVSQPKKLQMNDAVMKIRGGLSAGKKDAQAKKQPAGQLFDTENEKKHMGQRAAYNTLEYRAKYDPISGLKEKAEYGKEYEKAYDSISNDLSKNKPAYNTGLKKDWAVARKEDYDNNLTCILNDVQTISYALEPVNATRYEIIPVTQFPFFIGKLKENTDYCLEQNVVSRYHAKLTKEQDSFYLTDLNSTNGTFLNGEALCSYERKEIKEGDEIAFANIKYHFVVKHE